MRRTLALLAALTALAGAAGCGGDDGDPGAELEATLAAVEGRAGDEHTRVLLERAEQQGGGLSWYTSMSSELADAVAEAFGEEYDIDVAVYRASSETVLQRLVEEADAGFRGADVVELNGMSLQALNDRELLVPYESPAAAQVVPEAKHEGWTGSTLQTFAVSWNTRLVPDEERPRSWEDLADDRFRGRVAVDAGDVDWYKTLRDYWIDEAGKTEAEADALFERIARNARVVRGHTFLAQFMAAGEVAVGPNYAHRVQAFADEGAPLAWKPVVEPLIVQPNGVGVVAGARHAAAALLFVDWIASKGQDVLAEEGHEPVRRDLAAAPDAERRVVDFAALAAEGEQWTERFERLLRLGEQVESDP